MTSPDCTSGLRKAQVVSNKEVMPETFVLWCRDEGIASTAHPGQFLMVKCGAGNELVLRRPLSIHQVDTQGNVALLYSIVGSGTRWLAGLKSGDEIDVLGPLGRGFSISASTRRLLLVAGGIGISPLIFLAIQAVKKGLEIKLLLGVSTKAQLYPKPLLPEGIEIVLVTEDGSAGKKGLVTDYLEQLATRADQVCACGPVGMYKAMEAKKALWQCKSVQVSLETRMGCGIGACFGCTINTKAGLKRVCRDGPVFELQDILWSDVRV